MGNNSADGWFDCSGKFVKLTQTDFGYQIEYPAELPINTTPATRNFNKTQHDSLISLARGLLEFQYN